MPGFARSMRKFMVNSVADGFIALSVTDPLDDLSGFVEATTPGSSGYTRKAVVWDKAQPLPTAGQPVALVNTNVITWTSTGPWNLTRTVAWVLAVDVATGGDENTYSGWAPLILPKLVDRAGITITIPAGALKLTLGLEQY